MAEQASNVFPGASGFEIQGGQFYSAAGNIVIQSPQPLTVHPAQTANLASFTPLITSEERESATYARLLWSKGRGYPLWSPKPTSGLPEEYTKHGVYIGDVGIISADGAFDFLFNICKSTDHPINFNGVPPGFTPLREPNPSMVATDTEFSARSYLMSRSMQGGLSSSGLMQGGLSSSGSRLFNMSQLFNIEQELKYSFVCRNTDGALLLLPEGAFRQDIRNLERFRQYAAQHGESWYKFANREQQGREASNGSIHLVTGFDKSNSWAVAAFSNAPLTHVHPQIELELNGQKVHTECRSSLPTNVYSLGHSVSALTCDSGANFGVVEVTKTTDASFERISPGNASIPFRGSSPGFFGAVFGGSSSLSSGYPAHSQQLDVPQNRPDVMMNSTFVTGESDHPSRVINNFLLNKWPDAKVAISHDYQWALLASKFDSIDEDKVSQLTLTEFDVWTQDDAVFLVNATGNEGPLRSDNLNEFPASSCEVNNFANALTHAYCRSPYARERRPKNLVQSMTHYQDRKNYREEYLIVKIKNHDASDDFTSLKLEHNESPFYGGTSYRRFRPIFSGYAAVDTIEVVSKNYGRDNMFRSAEEVFFTDRDFTLHDLTMITKVVHELSEVGGLQFVGTVFKVVSNLYAPKEISDSNFMSGEGARALMEAAIALFERLKDTNEQVIRESVEKVGLENMEELEKWAGHRIGPARKEDWKITKARARLRLLLEQKQEGAEQQAWAGLDDHKSEFGGPAERRNTEIHQLEDLLARSSGRRTRFKK